uniref:Phosphatidylinositol 4,5-bisphosphate 3-kinase catalytic subunit gamma isoform-like n=1 Tax=Labrus bergylta TaxID=56723 RepID=A0A3Q3F2Z4_9LABR
MGRSQPTLHVHTATYRVGVCNIRVLDFREIAFFNHHFHHLGCGWLASVLRNGNGGCTSMEGAQSRGAAPFYWESFKVVPECIEIKMTHLTSPHLTSSRLIIGTGLFNFVQKKNPALDSVLGELTFTRRKLATPRTQELKKRDDLLYATEPWVTRVPIPNDMQDHPNVKLPVTLHYLSKISFSIQVDMDATPNVLLKVFQRVMANQKLYYDSSQNLVLKICGREEFLSGDYPLRDFLWVRQCLKNKQDLHVSVVPVSQLVDETVKSIDWPLIDGSTGQFSSQEDLRPEGKDLEDIFKISLWDCNRQLRVKLIGFDIPTLPNKCPQSVYVRASILYGNKVLSSVSSVSKSFADEVLWNEWFDFDVLLRDLPRGSKLSFTINASDGDNSIVNRDSNKVPNSERGKGKVLYFVNLLLIDHSLNLTKSTASSYAVPYGPSSPPSTSPNADSSSLHENAPQDPLTDTVGSTPRVVRTKRVGMKRFQQDSFCNASILPHYLRNVDWMNCRVVEDVHLLVETLDPEELDVTVALELLSMEFADVTVRRLAVKRLESLSNDDVLKYLLQLVQVCVSLQTDVENVSPVYLREVRTCFNIMPFLNTATKKETSTDMLMASKKKPLWLEFCPMPSPTPSLPVGIIFKQGDDLRQDMLVLQTLAVMDSIWQEKSLDLNLIPYGCISTGHNIGMIEIVRNAVTIASIQRNHGGTTGAFRNDALFEWLKSKSLQDVERFVKSCAGYCVATYVLGIGDRHNDNIMITDQGNLFHIDFGHILGNTKHFLCVNRERVPFVLTPDFLYVMGRVKGGNSLYFQQFMDTCTQAYLSLRSHSRLLVTLFSLMLLTGIPELSAAEDMRYLRKALQEKQSEADAKEHFLKQISVCENQGWKVQANWWIHMVAGIK